ncbi:transposase [Glycomyces xiaoerkulensis]|uniref:transposase n=1 Tax=Glycomyces xiaoerkulensis TaxID=2038139 RepID=UPI0012FFDF6F|nr:transposase [Glycomyces xiaoerkulensis]
MQRSGWSRRLDVEASGQGQVGNSGVVLLRLAADKCGLARALAVRMAASSVSSWVDRTQALVYTACAIAMGATGFERSTGYVYATTATNISRLKGIGGSHTLQWIDAVGRDHAEVEDRVRCSKATGLGNLPSASWQVNTAWIPATNIAADVEAWSRLLGFAGESELEGAEPAATIRAKIYTTGARLVHHARKRTLRLADTRPWNRHFAAAWAALTELPEPAT